MIFSVLCFCLSYLQRKEEQTLDCNHLIAEIIKNGSSPWNFSCVVFLLFSTLKNIFLEDTLWKVFSQTVFFLYIDGIKKQSFCLTEIQLNEPDNLRKEDNC